MQQQATDPPITARQPRLPAVRRGCFVLEIISGPDSGLSRRLTGGIFRVGKSCDNDVVLTDGAVSRHHLEIEVFRGHLRITDAASTNGTWIGQARVNEVSVSEPTRLLLGSATEIALAHEHSSARTTGLSRAVLRDLLGPTTATHRVCTLLDRAVRSDAPLLLLDPIQRDLVPLAAAIHRASGVRGPLVKVDCSCVAGDEPAGGGKELADAVSCDPVAALERAAGGTLLLAQIEKLSSTAQARLLRALEPTASSRLAGRADASPGKVRLIATAGCSLQPLVEAGRFRRDLYLRVAVDEVRLPAPTTDRAERAGPALEQFIAPHMMLLPFARAKGELVANFERHYLVDLLVKHRRNVSRAARAAHIGRSHMHRLLKKHSIELRAPREARSVG